MKPQNVSVNLTFRIICGTVALLLVATAAVCAIYLPRQTVEVLVPDPETLAALQKSQERITELEATIASNEEQIESYGNLVASYEKRINQLLDSSATDSAVARELKISEKTVQYHISR